MNNSSHGRQVSHSGSEQSIDAGLVRYIATSEKDVGTSRGSQVVHELLHLSGGRSTPGHKNNVPSPVGYHPPGHAATQTTCASDEHIGRVRAKQRLQRIGSLCCLRRWLVQTELGSGAETTYQNAAISIYCHHNLF